jgi:hypothetical protein
LTTAARAATIHDFDDRGPDNRGGARPRVPGQRPGRTCRRCRKGRQKNRCAPAATASRAGARVPQVYSVPRIGGQHEAYIVKALQQYKSGERSHPSMRAIATPLSEQDMADLAAYYAQGGVKTASK